MLIICLLFDYSKKVSTFVVVIKPHKYTMQIFEMQIIYGNFTI